MIEWHETQSNSEGDGKVMVRVRFGDVVITASGCSKAAARRNCLNMQAVVFSLHGQPAPSFEDIDLSDDYLFISTARQMTMFVNYALGETA